MTPQERQRMLNLADTIHGEINRMCVTDDLAELNFMAIVAKYKIDRLLEMREPHLTVAKFVEEKEE